MYLTFYKRKKKKTFKILAVCLILSALSAAYFLPGYVKQKKTKENIPVHAEKVQETPLPKEKVLTDGIMNVTYTYSCGHTEQEEKSIPSSYIGKTPSEILSEFNNIESIGFEGGILKASMNISSECMNHYIAKLYENTIKVYPSSNPNATEKEITINPDFFYNEELEELKKGISLDGRDEMLEFIENFQN